MTKPLLLMDFDRTLFDTDAFFDALWRLVADEYGGIDADHEKARKGSFLTYVGDLYDYAFHRHAADVLGDRYEEAALDALVKQRLSGKFLFDDATPEVIGTIDRIVTFGNEPYQRLKLSLCPEIEGIRTHIVHVPKGGFIAELFDVPTILVDDKPIQSEINPPARFIWLDRSATADVGSDDGFVAISSLRHLDQAIGQVSQLIDKR